jgi:polyhydroxyalkanoate synthesis repressor PhaR
MRVIKRYSNRKLYDTHESRYVTLDQLAELVRQGEEIRVVDNTTERDLTSATLAQIIFEQEKRSPKLPVEGLRQIIRSGLPAA